MSIVFQHFRDTANIGDQACSPYDYYDWPDAFAKDIRKPSPPYQVGIYGGGRIFGGLAREEGVIRGSGSLHIAWGVGTLQNSALSLKYMRARQMCDLVGSRDWGDTRYQWTPCVSSMSPLFDTAPAPTRETVFYYHEQKTVTQQLEIPAHIPSMSNEGGSFSDAIAFLASAETVVSNSYHGVFWGLLLGRKVVCVPFSKKFSSYRFAPHYSTRELWLDELGAAKAAPEMREVCREATDRFFNQVCDRINSHSQGSIPLPERRVA